jgi:phosphomannomutase
MTAIRFGTDGWRGIIADDFTFPNLRRVASAAADYFNQNASNGRRVLVGYDRRFFSHEFATTVYDVFIAKGMDAVLSDKPLPTPAVSVCVKAQNAAWGIMMTASHNPALYNGFKVKDRFGRSAAAEVTEGIEQRLDSTHVPSIPSGLKVRQTFDFLPPYEAYLCSRLDMKSLNSMKGHVLFDYLHGVGAGLPERLLRKGTLRTTALHAAIDPLFGGFHPEPIDPWLDPLKKEIKRQHALVGIALDGDADRLGVVDDKGQLLTPHQVFPLLALHAIEHRKLKGKVVQAVSLGVLGERIAKSFNLPFEEVSVGFKHVAERMVQEPVAAGGEESGGYAIGGGLPERDGVLNGLLFLELLAVQRKKPSELVAAMEKRFGRARFKRVDFPVPAPITDKVQFAKTITSKLPERLIGRPIVEVRPGDGVKIILDSGAWVLLRPSGTEPLLRTYAESDSWKNTDALLAWAKRIVNA